MTFTWNNIITTHYRWMASYLRRHGWVVFYLQEECRQCRTACWLELYQEEEARL